MIERRKTKKKYDTTLIIKAALIIHKQRYDFQFYIISSFFVFFFAKYIIYKMHKVSLLLTEHFTENTVSKRLKIVKRRKEEVKECGCTGQRRRGVKGERSEGPRREGTKMGDGR